MDAIVNAINAVDGFVWGPPMLVLLLGRDRKSVV